MSISADVLLQRLEKVRKMGDGWRARCPACGGHSDRDKLSIREADDRVLVYCFGGCRTDAVLAAVGLTWASIMPARNWPQSPEEKRQARRAMQALGVRVAVDVLALESKIVLFAARDILAGEPITAEDFERLREAAMVIEASAMLLGSDETWRPAEQREAA